MVPEDWIFGGICFVVIASLVTWNVTTFKKYRKRILQSHRMLAWYVAFVIVSWVGTLLVFFMLVAPLLCLYLYDDCKLGA